MQRGIKAGFKSCLCSPNCQLVPLLSVSVNVLWAIISGNLGLDLQLFLIEFLIPHFVLEDLYILCAYFKCSIWFLNMELV